MNILLTVAYDGTNYCGWQNQKNGIAVQQRLEESLSCLYKQAVQVVGASRTDAGVHALGQRAMYHMPDKIRIPEDRLPYAINAHLPPDIVVVKAEIVSDSFHPIYSAKKKTYEYGIYCNAFMNPLLLNRRCYVNHMLDMSKMNEACSYFVGEHNFKAFCAAGSTAKTHTRTIYCLELLGNDGDIIIRVTGNGFLYNMVRIIAGTLIYVGEGKIMPDSILDIIQGGKREAAGKTAPPQGLTLINVDYGQ